MTLKNVQKIETQEQHQKTWFQKFRSKFVPAAVVTGGLIAANAHAAAGDPPDFLGTATSSLGTIAIGLGTLFAAAIGITLLVMAFSTSKGGIKKAG
ncbi:hypothetical protein IC784_08940 [Acinetobacter seifertii]|uniref:Uncharacterized protein n=1 Tax=Acinetobacter seifertii TaxID=1530123 RepID=A0A7H2TEH1_9GAMM|nr:hypothetical protein IC795_10000 [Acinetobacter seifertii]QNX50254.1 hypothetical protein IC784_08860 [Acinetobacter seifertii]QNX50260.1 hypothetical protein IC784_08900 [Acinetobacter seifertii]QNX50266.1 hypothetical protein IC784_08940 [Acinetobacter seifertii]